MWGGLGTLILFNIHVPPTPQGADKTVKGPNGLTAFEAAETEAMKALLKWDTTVSEVAGQVDEQAYRWMQWSPDRRWTPPQINLCLNTAFVCLLDVHLVCLVIFLYLNFFSLLFPNFFGIVFSLLLASVCKEDILRLRWGPNSGVILLNLTPKTLFRLEIRLYTINAGSSPKCAS